MSTTKQDMLPLQDARKKLAWALRLEPDHFEALKLTPQQVRMLGTRAGQVIVNAPTAADVPLKIDTFTCQECGKDFKRQYRTRRFKWCSETCRMRNYRRRKAYAQQKNNN